MAQAVELTGQKCVACRADSPRVTEAEIGSFHPQVPEWELLDDVGVLKLRRVYRFKDFAGALAFTNRVGEIAEDEGHHPLVSTEWGRVARCGGGRTRSRGCTSTISSWRRRRMGYLIVGRGRMASRESVGTLRL